LKSLSTGLYVIQSLAGVTGVPGLVEKALFEAGVSNPAGEYMNKKAPLKDIFPAWIFLPTSS
jgi:hypothetical protein